MIWLLSNLQIILGKLFLINLIYLIHGKWDKTGATSSFVNEVAKLSSTMAASSAERQWYAESYLRRRCNV